MPFSRFTPTPMALAVSLALTPLFAHGQSGATAAGNGTDTPAETTMATIVITGEAGAQTEGSGKYTTGGITIGKGMRSLRETPQSVSVMTRQRLDDQNLRTLEDALQNTTGITVEQSSSYERAFYSRGFLVDTVQYDGVAVQSGSGTGFAISPDLSIYDRVEVLRGPAGLFNGAGQPGGTVNLVRKRPLATPQAVAQLSAGRWDNYRAEGDLSVSLNDNGTVRARMVGAHEDRDFFYDVASTKKTVAYGIVEADLGPRTTLGAGVQYEKNDLTPFYGGLPRFADGGDLNLPRATYLNAAWSRSKVDSGTVFADLNHRFNSDWKAKVAVSRMREDNHDISGSNYGAVDRLTLAGQSVSSFRQHLVGTQKAADATLEGRFDAFGRRHDVIVGANYQQRDYDLTSQLFTVPNAAFNPYTFNPQDYPTAPTVPGRAATHTLTATEQSGLYGSLRLALSDALKLTLGGRLSRTKNAVRNLVTNAYSTAPYKESGELTPYGALSYDLTPAWSAYVSYAEIFRSQADQFTAAGEHLKPATGANYEAGIKGALMGGRLNASAALFRINETNRSQADPANPSPCLASPTLAACYVAEGKVRSQGLDAELSGAMTPAWQLTSGYTFNQTKYVRDSTATGAPSANQGAPLSSFTPRHMVRIWSGYRLPGDLSAWNVGGGVNLQSMSYKTSGALRFQQGGYAVWSGRVSYRINRNLTASLNLSNLFDKTYYRTLGSTTGSNWYGEPRNVSASLQALF